VPTVTVEEAQAFAKDNGYASPTEEERNGATVIDLGNLDDLEDALRLNDAPGTIAAGSDAAGSNVVIPYQPDCTECRLQVCACTFVIVVCGVVICLVFGFQDLICFILKLFKLPNNCAK
jgi:hypothetical protein